MAAPLAPLTPYASARHFFGAELRHLRMRAGLSHYALAVRVHVQCSLIGKVELAQRHPSRDLAERCDRVLGAAGELLRLHGLVQAERDNLPPPCLLPRWAPRGRRHCKLLAWAATGTHVPRRPLNPDLAAVLDRVDAALRAASVNHW